MIRFPGNWFGDKKDLVPLGPAADVPLAVQPTEVPAEPLSADDFWGEGAGDLHQAVDVVAHGEAVPVPERPTVRTSPVRVQVRLSAAELRDRLNGLVDGRWRLPVAAAVVVAVVLVIAASGLLSGLAAPRTVARIPTRHVTARPVTIGTDFVVAEDLVRQVRLAVIPAGRVERAARRARPRVSAAVPTRHRAVDQTVGATAKPSGTSDLASDANSASEAPSVDSGTDDSGSSTAAAANSSGPAGPIGQGTSGSNCDPQCT